MENLEIKTQPRTRAKAGSNEIKDINTIVSSIHNRTPNGLKIIAAFKERFGVEILDAKIRPGNRKVHFDFLILVSPSPGVWKNVEHKGSKTFTPVPGHQTPWGAGVQFHNGGCEKYSIAKKYAKIWYDLYIVSGSLKEEWKLEAPIPSFDDWFQKDVRCQGNPKTAFGKELKEAVRKVRGPDTSLLEKRAAVNERFDLSDEELQIFKQEVIQVVNEVLEVKDYWLTIHGDPETNMYCAWFPKFTINDIQCMMLDKGLDIKIHFMSPDINFYAMIRWGKGAGFSNLRVDLR